MMLLPPKPGTCPACAHVHAPAEPHNSQSMYYQYRFFGLRGRWPTWADALAHCEESVREKWKAHLVARKVYTEPPDGEVIADPPAETLAQPVGDINSRGFGPEKDDDV